LALSNATERERCCLVNAARVLTPVIKLENHNLPFNPDNGHFSAGDPFPALTCLIGPLLVKRVTELMILRITTGMDMMTLARYIVL
jgi:hypothetical protein